MIGVENTINLWFKQTLTLIGNCFILVCEFKTLNCFYRHTRFMVVREEKLRHFSERGQETVLSLWCIYDILCYEGRKVNLFMFLAFAKNVVLELNMNMISLAYEEYFHVMSKY